MLKTANTALTTVGNGTITGAALKGQIITRSGPTGAFTDTTDTATNILAAFPGLAGTVTDPITFQVKYINTTAYTATLAADASVTLNKNTGVADLTVATNTVATLLITLAPAAGAVTVTVIIRNAAT